jgi:hypothetical protein
MAVSPFATPRSFAGPRSSADLFSTRRKFFWRRVVVVAVIAGLGALAWNATERLMAAAGGELSGGALCSPSAGTTQLQAVRLAAEDLSSAPSSAQGEQLELYGGHRDTCSQVYVARPGDTLWAVATRFSRGGDPRALVAGLEAQVGGAVLQPGERLAVP